MRLVWDFDGGGGGGHVFVCVWVSWEYRNSMYFLLNFLYEPKTAPKIKVY